MLNIVQTYPNDNLKLIDICQNAANTLSKVLYSRLKLINKFLEQSESHRYDRVLTIKMPSSSTVAAHIS